jgi:hypothetical protein
VYNECSLGVPLRSTCSLRAPHIRQTSVRAHESSQRVPACESARGARGARVRDRSIAMADGEPPPAKRTRGERGGANRPSKIKWQTGHHGQPANQPQASSSSASSVPAAPAVRERAPVPVAGSARASVASELCICCDHLAVCTSVYCNNSH